MPGLSAEMLLPTDLKRGVLRGNLTGWIEWLSPVNNH